MIMSFSTRLYVFRSIDSLYTILNFFPHLCNLLFTIQALGPKLGFTFVHRFLFLSEARLLQYVSVPLFSVITYWFPGRIHPPSQREVPISKCWKWKKNPILLKWNEHYGISRLVLGKNSKSCSWLIYGN